MFCSSFTPSFSSVLIMTNMLCSNVSLKYYSQVLRTGKISLKVPHLRSKEQSQESRYREQENCSVEPRITEHRLQVLNEVKQLFRLNSYTIIRSQGVTHEEFFPSRLKTRSRRQREQVS